MFHTSLHRQGVDGGTRPKFIAHIGRYVASNSEAQLSLKTTLEAGVREWYSYNESVTPARVPDGDVYSTAVADE